MIKHLLLATLAAASVASAQNLVPNGQFHLGSTDWTMTAFNDPAGTTGFGSARVAGYGPSEAVFADFQTLSGVRSATYRSTQVILPAGPLPVGFRAMWEKQVTAPIPFPSVNRVELRIIDSATNTAIYTGTLNSPNQTGLIERDSFVDVVTIPATTTYEIELFLRHSNLAGIPFTCWVDDVYINALDVDYFGQGCQGYAGYVPAIGTSNAPLINTTNFTLEISDTFAPTVAVVVVDYSNTTWAGGALPFALGNGCNLLVGTTGNEAHVTTGTGGGIGMASQPLPIPNNPALAGQVLYTQWAVADIAAANPFGLAMSAGMYFTIR